MFYHILLLLFYDFISVDQNRSIIHDLKNDLLIKESFIYKTKESAIYITDDLINRHLTVQLTTISNCSSDEQAAFYLGRKICLRFSFICINNCNAHKGFGSILHCKTIYNEKDNDFMNYKLIHHQISYLSAFNNKGPTDTFYIEICEQNKATNYPVDEIKNCNFSKNSHLQNDLININSGLFVINSFNAEIYQCTFENNSNKYSLFQVQSNFEFLSTHKFHYLNILNNNAEFSSLIYAVNCTIEIDICHCSFVDNICYNNSLLYVENSIVNIMDIYSSNEFKYKTNEKGAVRIQNITNKMFIHSLSHFQIHECISQYPNLNYLQSPTPTNVLISSTKTCFCVNSGDVKTKVSRFVAPKFESQFMFLFIGILTWIFLNCKIKNVKTIRLFWVF